MYIKRFLSLLAVLALSACAVANPDTDPLVDLGDFRLGHNVVVTKNAQKIGPSRTFDLEAMDVVLTEAMQKRFGRYQGDKLYHIGVNVDGYALAVPGVPVVLSPKSAIVVSVTVWDDAAGNEESGGKLNDPPRQLTVLEQLDGGTIFGSGLTRSKEVQLDNLAAQMAAAVERFLLENGEWFGVTPIEALPEPDLAAAGSVPEGGLPVVDGEIIATPLPEPDA